MAIAGIDPKCYILALFVRDDGVRFLLGDDPYEFKDKQLHFQPNTVANDVVEVQGNDGYLLAGQVRRPGTQSFDGYVCNGTNSKTEVEAKRREFLQFFRRSHFYKVIYVFPNGTAIQRKQGFLVDDPTVQELYQQYPEYHVALNFEDVNYYTYEEDDQGQEIYAKEAIVPLAGGGATGGLIWDEYGVVWEEPWSDLISVSGSEIQIDNEAGARAPIQDLELQGDTYQQGSPSPDNPQAVQTVTGEQTLTVTGKNKFNINGTVSEISATRTVSENTLTATMSSTGGNRYVAIEIPNSSGLLGKTVTLSYTLKNISDANSARLSMYFGTLSNPARNAIFDGAIKGSSSVGKSVERTVTIPGSLPASGLSIFILVYANTNSTSISTLESVEYSNIQLEVGSATAYEPYQGQSYPISLGTTELCKIGDYQDYIYKSGDDWYIHKEVGKYTLTGQEDWRLHNSVRCFYDAGNSYGANGGKVTSDNTILPNIISSHFTEGTYQRIWSNADQEGIAVAADGTSNPRIRVTSITTLTDFKDMITAKQPEIYYPLATPTDTKITNTTLIGQLEALGAMKLFIGENNLLVSATGTNLPATLEFSYPTKFAAIGAEWEEGGTKGATIVDVNAIDNTYPVWELMGPAVNPTISVLTTNTTLTYNGTITASQKLVIDMFNKTATLNGTSVIGNVSGDFVYMTPGTNRIAYTAGNTDAPDSTIYWQEVVG